MGESDEHSSPGFFGLPASIIQNGTDLADGTAFNNVTDNNPAQQDQLLDMTSLPDWYSGDVSLYGLLEQDFDSINEMGFGYFGDGTDNV